MALRDGALNPLAAYKAVSDLYQYQNEYGQRLCPSNTFART